MDVSHNEHFHADEAKSTIASESMNHPPKQDGAQLSAHEADKDLGKLLNRFRASSILSELHNMDKEKETINLMIPDSNGQTSGAGE